MTLLNKNDALALLKKYHVSRRVMEHLMAVHDYAMEIASNVECDRGLVEVGSLLHDIGRSKSFGIDHAIIGADILRKEGVEESIVNIVERHVGAGLTPGEAKKLGLPPGDYVPKTIEEKIVCHADNLIGGAERIQIKEAIQTARNKWFPGSVKRLIKMHFEVFRPDVVTIQKNALNGVHGDFRGLKKFLDERLKDFDLLYKVEKENGNVAVSMFGQDSKKAADFLIKKGIATPG